MFLQVGQSPSIETECKKSGIEIEDIKKLRKWLDTQQHLPSKHITDLDLVLAFHSCNQSSEVSKQVLDLNFTLRTLFTNVFKNRCLDAGVLNAIDVVLTMPLEIRTYDHSAVSYHRLIDYDARKFVLADCVRVALMLLDIWQIKMGTWPGFVIVIDLEGVRLSHLGKLDITEIQQYIYYLQEAMFVKLKAIHFLNAPAFMDKILMLIKPFLKKELLDSLIIHKAGSRAIGEYLPIEGLPKEAGGQYKTYAKAKEDILALLKANEDFFISESKKRVEESLRPGKPKNITDFFGGIEGSFKKLDID
ncbi:unnamed protein product [Parnassius apollo]|uniref:(apollo) hypothetical protein n=1 Tax=Parnassius apollo TaxID=110799 RepID=A0A8S3WLX9_PARAO|nr:unnamed protein product [Parnassius apollo]